ncbi:SDR family NAD(P)-dependent oxidoreductase [Rhodococcus sp. NPDC057014]|uniref:SDR family NAD(P)-dependent oxidoreductase n=1 Tax=Rhodococcus sp. NPDC057014 TaxID=3346000 RepID=UPI00362D60B6
MSPASNNPKVAHTARLLADTGCRVIAHSFSADAAEAVAAEITATGATAYPAEADWPSKPKSTGPFTHVETHHGGIDALIHTAWLPGPETTAHNLSERV